MPDQSPQIRVTAMPTDVNPYGGVFGGWLMSQMALGAGSLTIAAEAVGRTHNDETETRVAQGAFKFVLLGENDRPRAVAAVTHG